MSCGVSSAVGAHHNRKYHLFMEKLKIERNLICLPGYFLFGNKGSPVPLSNA